MCTSKKKVAAAFEVIYVFWFRYIFYGVIDTDVRNLTRQYNVGNLFHVFALQISDWYKRSCKYLKFLNTSILFLHLHFLICFCRPVHYKVTPLVTCLTFYIIRNKMWVILKKSVLSLPHFFSNLLFPWNETRIFPSTISWGYKFIPVTPGKSGDPPDKEFSVGPSFSLHFCQYLKMYDTSAGYDISW